MLQDRTPAICWGFGLSPEQELLLRHCLGDKSILTLWSVARMPDPQEMETATPCLLWLSSQGQRQLAALPEGQTRLLECLPKALLLDDAYSPADLENACDAGITEIVRPTLTRARAGEIVRRALAAQTLHDDMYCMTREIVLERELLERKNEILTFLVNFLTTTSHSMDLNHILQTTFTSLGRLFPVHTLNAIIWRPEAYEANHPVSLYVAAPESSSAFFPWRETLLEQARLLTGSACAVENTFLLDLSGQKNARPEASPQDGHLLFLPIATGAETFGVIVLLTDLNRNLGRDQNLALESAMRHLGLILKNLYRFQKLQHHADYDGLTHVHSRRHLEQRLELEMDRYRRYKSPLSLIMLDIDHFKHVNDTHGHTVGDAILRETASVIMQTIRTSDYCARYGGEEFLLLLPHTDSRKACSLAERLRLRLAAHTFIVDGTPLNITISLGVSTLVPTHPKTSAALISEADTALYEAKTRGRNQTRNHKNIQLPLAAVSTG
jgi:diguanylate cyclase (GGDEF)-like protein